MSNETKSNQSLPKLPAGRGPGPMRGGPMGMAGGVKAKDFKGAIKKLWSYLSAYKFAILVTLIFAAGSTVLAVIGPKRLGEATTELVKALMNRDIATGVVNLDAVHKILITLLIIYGISGLLSFVQAYIMAIVTVRVSYNLRKAINEKIDRMPFGYFDGISYGDVLSRLTNDVDTISNTLGQSLTQIITSTTSVIGILYMMFSIDVSMTFITLVILPFALLFITRIVKASQKYFRAQQSLIGAVNGHVEEMYGGHSVITAYNGEEKSEKAFDAKNGELSEVSRKANFISSIMMPLMGFIGNISYVAMSVYGGYLAIKGSLQIGDIQAFLQYVRQFNQPLSQLANISNVMQQTAAASERVFEFLDEAEESPDPVNNESVEDIITDVDFDHVVFGYKPDRVIIKDFNCSIKEGQKVAIVGPTGGGKTTIVKLLMRFYDVNSGSISIGGKNINSFTRNDLRSLFGMVLQDTWLFNGTLLENIRYGNENATDEQVYEAAKAAYADHFIKALPDGYNMVLNEDATNISAGQKQLITIARAILANPRMLILDEATSSVDTRTEVLIQKAMDNLSMNRTSFVIAHRLSTIRNADIILVIKEGDIIEQGRHEELLALDGFYAQLYNSQFTLLTA